jgi:hypothetical protein
MFGGDHYSEPRGCQMLQVQVSVATVIVMRRPVRKTETLYLWGTVTVEAIQNGGFAKRIYSDRR